MVPNCFSWFEAVVNLVFLAYSMAVSIKHRLVVVEKVLLLLALITLPVASTVILMITFPKPLQV